MQQAARPLKICVIGAGIVGAASAYALQHAGHDVVLLDSGAAPGSLATLANGAQLNYGHVEPLAKPAMPRQVPSWLFDPDAPIGLRLRGGLPMLRWGMAFLRACRQAPLQRSTQALMALAYLSRDELAALQSQANIDFCLHTPGTLTVHTDVDEWHAATHQVAFQQGLGCEQTLLQAQECIEHEPTLLRLRSRLLGGVWTPGEQSGDPHLLCRALTHILETNGARFSPQTRATGFAREGQRISAVHTDNGDVRCDAVVLANGSEAPTLAAHLGLWLPICPIKGHSITLPLLDVDRAPVVNVRDAALQISYTRLGEHLRVAGTSDMVGHDLRRDPHRIRSLVNAARDTFPGACEFTADPHAWAGLRASTPTSLPLIGPTRWSNVWLNAGHGALGFTLAMGSARLLERWIAGDVDAQLAAPFLLPR